MNKQIIINGVGGQGVIFLSEIISKAALKKNYKIKVAETLGMARRGGSVISFIKIGFGEFEKNRQEIVYETVKSKALPFGDENSATGLWYNGVITIESWKSTSVLPYIDFGIGFGSQELPDWAKDYFDKDRISYFGLGLGIGAYIKLNNNLETKIGFRSESYNWQKIQYESCEYQSCSGYYYYSCQTKTLTMTTNITGLNFALSYRF